jgi:transcriptional regulator with XRE-family HTH domain
MATGQKVSGQKIRQARLRAGMTQAALARIVGTSERNIVRWENDRNAPRMEHVAAIARFTNSAIGDLLASDDEDKDSRGGMTLDDFLRERVRELVALERAG